MSRKKKLISMLWEEVRPVKFTEKQWVTINQRIRLPDEARLLIERNASLYKFHESNHAGYPTRSEAIAELKIIGQLAKRLSIVLKNIGDRSGYALVDTAKNVNWKSAREIWRTRLEAINEISANVPEAINIVRGQKKVKSGPNSFAIDHLVEQLDKIICNYKKGRVNRGQVYVDFMLKIANAADLEITPGTIDASLKRVIKKQKLKSVDS